MPIIANAANFLEPPERREHREKDVDTPEAQFHSMVAKPIPLRDALKIPAAKEALDNEWAKLWSMKMLGG